MPDEDRPVIVNTSPIITLSLAGRLELLRDIYQSVLIPPTVRKEVLHGGTRAIGVAELRRADWIQVEKIQRGGVRLSRLLVEEVLRLADEL